LEYIENNYMSLPKSGSEAITAIKQARSAPVQEPVAYRSRLASGSYTYCNTPQFFDNAEPLYTAAPAARRQWVGLTDDEFENIELGCRSTPFGKIEAMRKVEAKLKEKNGGVV
jgi:hypothetical protein